MQTKITIQSDGKLFWLINNKGQYWMGPKLPLSAQWEAPKEKGADVPCWLSSSEQSAQCQASLLMSSVEPSPWEVLYDYHFQQAQWWRDNHNDPHQIGTAMYAMHMSLFDAYSKILNR